MKHEDHIAVFTRIYENCVWGNNRHTNYEGSSGPGSALQYNQKEYIPFLKKYIAENNIKKVVDLGCGDFRCGPSTYSDLNVEYVGYDAYEKIIIHNKSAHTDPKYTFIHMDFLNKKEDLQTGDMCILKDVFLHWTVEEIYDFLDYLVSSRKYKKILICNCKQQYKDNPSNKNRLTYFSAKMLPLKKYNPIILLQYNTKEVSVIDVE